MEEVKKKVRVTSGASSAEMSKQCAEIKELLELLETKITKADLVLNSSFLEYRQIRVIIQESFDTMSGEIRSTFTGMGVLLLINTVVLCVLLYRSLTGCL